MAKKKHSYRHAARKIPLGATLGVFGTILGRPRKFGRSTIDCIIAGDYPNALNTVMVNMTGYDMNSGTWSLQDTNLAPLILGTAVSIAASKLGLNRRLNIPFVKI